LKPTQTNSLRDPISRKTLHKKELVECPRSSNPSMAKKKTNQKPVPQKQKQKCLCRGLAENVAFQEDWAGRAAQGMLLTLLCSLQNLFVPLAPLRLTRAQSFRTGNVGAGGFLSSIHRGH
jgi:hypothetical protein